MFKGDVGRFNAMVKRITDIGLEDDVNIAFKYEGDVDEISYLIDSDYGACKFYNKLSI